MHLYPRAHVIAVYCISLGKQRYTTLAHYEARPLQQNSSSTLSFDIYF